jgi:hypothetical protein
MSRFRLTRITATSGHPVRYDPQRIIEAAQHILWEPANTRLNANNMCLQPTVFAYNFGQPIADQWGLRVTVTVNDDLLNTPVILYGTTQTNGTVFQSNAVTFTVVNPPPIAVPYTHFTTSNIPFTLRADVTWRMKLAAALDQEVVREGNGLTRLELYWIAPVIHQAFANGIPIVFLRRRGPEIIRGLPQPQGPQPQGPQPHPQAAAVFYTETTNRIFNFGKIYNGAIQVVTQIIRGTDIHFFFVFRGSKFRYECHWWELSVEQLSQCRKHPSQLYGPGGHVRALLQPPGRNLLAPPAALRTPRTH